MEILESISLIRVSGIIMKKNSILLKMLNGQLLRYLKNCIPHRQNVSTNTGFPGGILMRTTNKICPCCGKKMKQQFIGLQHCKCGMSWKKDLGFFERTPDMVFCLRKTNDKKYQPLILYQNKKSKP